MYSTSEEYYDDLSNHGSYQYITLDQLVTDYSMSRVEGDITLNVPRHKILYYARRSFKDLYSDVVKQHKAVRLSIPKSLTLVLPEDFIDYVRISWVTEDNYLVPLTSNPRINISKDYLQDDEYRLIFDSNGHVIQTDTYPNADDISQDDGDSYSAYRYNTSFKPSGDRSTSIGVGEFSIDKDSGLIRFSSNIYAKEIVIEYVSDGLYTGSTGKGENSLRIHKYCEDAVQDYIYYQLIKRNVNIPAIEKQRAKKDYYNSRRVAKRRLTNLTREDLTRMFRKSTIWIKGENKI